MTLAPRPSYVPDLDRTPTRPGSHPELREVPTVDLRAPAPVVELQPPVANYLSVNPFEPIATIDILPGDLSQEGELESTTVETILQEAAKMDSMTCCRFDREEERVELYLYDGEILLARSGRPSLPVPGEHPVVLRNLSTWTSGNFKLCTGAYLPPEMASIPPGPGWAEDSQDLEETSDEELSQGLFLNLVT